jgi:hypothetical protein
MSELSYKGEKKSRAISEMVFIVDRAALDVRHGSCLLTISLLTLFLSLCKLLVAVPKINRTGA